MDLSTSSIIIDFSKYTNRLNTYASNKWPASAPQYIKSLAEAGLVYTGVSDLVICFQCGIELSDWSEEDEPLKRHKEVNKECHFISQNLKKSLDQNIHNNQYKFCDQSMKSEKHRFQSFAQCPVQKHWPSPELLSRSGLYYDCNKKQMICFCCGFMVDAWESSEQDPFVKHRVQSSHCLFIQGRLNIQCFSESEDDKFDFSQKPLLMPAITYNTQTHNELGEKPSSNIIKNIVEEKQPSSTNHLLNDSLKQPKNNSLTYSNIGSEGISERNSTVMQQNHTYNIEWTKPAIDYSKEHSRLQTFFSYPRNSPVPAFSLFEAGFYYLGKDDEVVCYMCKLSLKCFEEGDTAWGEHKRHSPTCPLVIKSQNFRQENQSRDIFYHMPAFPSAFLNRSLHLSDNEIDHSFNRSSNGLPNHYYNKNSNNNLKFFRNCSVDLPQDYPAEPAPTKQLKTNKKFNSEGDLKNASPPELNVNDNGHYCVICMDKKVEVTFSPCGHLVACVLCASGQTMCPICRRCIDSKLRTYLS